jgi:hypothetical protein
MKKIAFLFLTLDNPNFPKIWNSYFKGHSDKYTIYIHPKYPEKVTWQKNRIIKNLQITAWGFITRAYMELLKEAYKDQDNYKFVTISESCIPIQSFDAFYKECINDRRSFIKISPISRYDWEERLFMRDYKERENAKKIIKHYARFCLNREHVKLLLEKEKALEYFHKMHVGDEFFLSVLYPLKNYKDFAVTYDDWEFIGMICKEIKNSICKLYIEQEKNNKVDKSADILKYQKEYEDKKKNPKTITDVKPDLEKIKKCSSFFYRKFAKDSDIEKYWKEIIKAHDIQNKVKL